MPINLTYNELENIMLNRGKSSIKNGGVTMVTKFGDLQQDREPVFPDAKRLDTAPIGKTLTIKNFQTLPSSYGGEFAVVLAELDNEEISFSTGSSVLMTQLNRMKEKLPVEATIIETKSKRTGRMYQTFS